MWIAFGFGCLQLSTKARVDCSCSWLSPLLYKGTKSFYLSLNGFNSNLNMLTTFPLKGGCLF